MAGVEVPFAQLFFQGLVERGGVREGDFFGPLVFAPVVLLQFVVGDVVFGQVVVQRVISGVVRVVRKGVRFCSGGVVVCRRLFFAFFQCGVLKEFGTHAVFQFHGREFEQLYQQDLLRRERLYLLLGLCLYLSGALCHALRVIDYGFDEFHCKDNTNLVRMKRTGVFFYPVRRL